MGQIQLLVSLVMTCSDINAAARPWDHHYKVTSLIYKEFFEQGDVEKGLGITPIPMMVSAQVITYAYIPACVDLCGSSSIKCVACRVYVAHLGMSARYSCVDLICQVALIREFVMVMCCV